jgi:L-cystine uptake protein TcyP (sodium:dicarboxylate symporter family)
MNVFAIVTLSKVTDFTYIEVMDVYVLSFRSRVSNTLTPISISSDRWKLHLAIAFLTRFL